MSDHDAAPVQRAPLTGPIGWVIAAHGLSSLAFFAFYGVVFAQAAYEHDAGPGQTAILGVALSIPFILGSLLQGIVVDRWSPKWMATIGCGRRLGDRGGVGGAQPRRVVRLGVPRRHLVRGDRARALFAHRPARSGGRLVRANKGIGFTLMYPPPLAFIQRQVAEQQRGRVTSVFVALQEAMWLLSSFVILSIGNAVPIQGTLVVGGLLLAMLGAAGMQVARRAPTVVAVDGSSA